MRTRPGCMLIESSMHELEIHSAAMHLNQDMSVLGNRRAIGPESETLRIHVGQRGKFSMKMLGLLEQFIWWLKQARRKMRNMAVKEKFLLWQLKLGLISGVSRTSPERSGVNVRGRYCSGESWTRISTSIKARGSKSMSTSVSCGVFGGGEGP